VLIVAAVIWASLSTVDQIVTAQGKLVTTQPKLVVQPLETSVIRGIEVAVGDVVKRGHALATLDPTFPKADVDALRTRITAFDAAIERLKAELDGRDFTPPDPANPEDAVQARLFRQRKGYYEASLGNYDAQIASLQAELQTNEAEGDLTARRLDTLRSIEAMRSELMSRETESRLNFLLSRASRLEVEDSLSRMRGDQVDLAHKLEKTRAERQVFIADFRRTALQDLVDFLAKRDTAAEDLKKAELRQHMVALTSPADAVVLEIAHCSRLLIARSGPWYAKPRLYSRWCRSIRLYRPRSMSTARTSAKWRSASRCGSNSTPFRSRNTARLRERCVSSAGTRSHPKPPAMQQLVRRGRRRVVQLSPSIGCWST
jgi:hemolysin D